MNPHAALGAAHPVGSAGRSDKTRTSLWSLLRIGSDQRGMPLSQVGEGDRRYSVEKLKEEEICQTVRSVPQSPQQFVHRSRKLIGFQIRFQTAARQQMNLSLSCLMETRTATCRPPSGSFSYALMNWTSSVIV